LGDHVQRRGGSIESADTQRITRENFERNTPSHVRDGVEVGKKDPDTKETRVTFEGNDELTIIHGLRRRPKGWSIHTMRGSGHSVREVSSDDQEIVLVNDFSGAGTLTCGIWIW
jgi:hypothetical protein